MNIEITNKSVLSEFSLPHDSVDFIGECRRFKSLIVYTSGMKISYQNNVDSIQTYGWFLLIFCILIVSCLMSSFFSALDDRVATDVSGQRMYRGG